MSGFFRKYRRLIIAIVILLVLIITVIVSTGDRNISFGENLIGTVTKPVTSFFSNTFSSVNNFFFSKSKENDVLRAENNELKKDVATLSETLNENKRLKELVNYQSANGEYEYVSAGVTARSGNYFFSTFTIGVGKSSGVDAGMPVVSGNGLIGKVYEAGATWSKVISITDSTSSVSAIIERTRDSGTVKSGISSDGKTFELYMEHMPLDSSVQPGDSVITSGLGGTYPKGIVIGTVGEVEQSNNGDKVVTIKPTSDFLRIEEVMVIKSSANKNFLE